MASSAYVTVVRADDSTFVSELTESSCLTFADIIEQEGMLMITRPDGSVYQDMNARLVALSETTIVLRHWNGEKMVEHPELFARQAMIVARHQTTRAQDATLSIEELEDATAQAHHHKVLAVHIKLLGYDVEYDTVCLQHVVAGMNKARDK